MKEEPARMRKDHDVSDTENGIAPYAKDLSRYEDKNPIRAITGGYPMERASRRRRRDTSIQDAFQNALEFTGSQSDRGIGREQAKKRTSQ